MIRIYTDGAASGNPGPGGYGIVMISEEHRLRKEFSEGFRLTTNNRMELLAVIVALEKLKKPQQEVVIYSDSAYVVNTVEKGWLWQWVQKGFKGKKNEDLWRRYLPLHQQHRVKFQWIKGHAGHPLNERCDQLATEAYKLPSLSVDVVFEREQSQKPLKPTLT